MQFILLINENGSIKNNRLKELIAFERISMNINKILTYYIYTKAQYLLKGFDLYKKIL